MRNLHRAARALTLACAGTGLLAAAPAQASCSGIGIFSCSATTSATTPLAFGNYNPTVGTATTSSGVVSVQGTISGTAGLLVTLGYTISLSAGNSGSTANRYLTNGTTNLGYNLYTSSGYGTVWGNNSVSGSMALTIQLIGSVSQTNTHTVYGSVPAGQYTAAPGAYTDAITVTVTY